MRKTDVFKKRTWLALFFFLSVSFVAFSQEVQVTGTVTDVNGESLPGVNIVVEGTSEGTITDVEGTYNIEVPGDATLVFNFVGFEKQVVAVEGRNTIDVVLKEELLSLDEVVVVGYGTQRKSDITGSVSSVDAAKIGDVPSSDISRSLQGKAAGVEIQSTSRRPGGGTRIRIRGNRSLTASNDPLIVVDGIPFNGDISDINDDDIESMEVLKDASATVIYGSRGSNGVIIIETKRGEAGEMKVNYEGYYGISTVSRPYDVFNAEEFVKLRDVAGYTNYLSDEKESMLIGRETDWQELIYQNGVTVNQEFSISGGSEKTQYSFSGSYYDESGVMPEIGYSRYNLKTTLDQQIGEYIKVGLSSMNTYAITDGQSAGNMWPLVSLTPLSTPYNNDGTLNEQPVYDTEETYNPLTLQDKERWDEQNRRFASFNSLYGEAQLYEGLKYRVNLGIDFRQNKYNNFYGSKTPMRDGGLNTAQVQNSDNLAWTLENMLMYNQTFDEHRLDVTAMFSTEESTSTSSRFDAQEVPADYLQYHNLSLAEQVISPTDNNYYSQWGLMSYMGRINYSFRDTYLLTLTGRADGSSRLAEGNKWHSYPAIAVGWNIINESFVENADWLTNLKLRAGYGETSNTAIDPYSTLGGLSQNLYNFGDRGVKGYYVSNLPNEELGWEFTKSTNIGLDFAFFEGRISGSVDAYLQETEDLLLGKELPASQGVPGSFLENVGSTENRGLEVVLDGVLFRPDFEGDFGWNINSTVFLNREEITALQDPTIKRDVGNGWFVGEPTSAIFDYEKIGIWQSDEAEEAAEYGMEPGRVKIKDQNEDGQITEEDRVILGSSQPDFQGGFTTSWEYLGFDLSVVGYYRVGGTIISTIHQPNEYINRLDGRRTGIKVDYWSENNPTNDMPKPDVNIETSYTSTLGYFDGSFLKIRSINLGYTLPGRWTNFMGSNSSVRVYSTVVDPFIFFSSYVDKGGVDPEPTGQGPGIDANQSVPDRALVVGLETPPTTQFIFGLNVKF